MGEEWVKQPKGAKGCEIWRPLVGLGNVRVDSSLQFAEDLSQIVTAGESRAKLNLTVRGFRGIFLDAEIRVWPVRLACVGFTWAIDLNYLPRGLGRGLARVPVGFG